MTGLQSIPHARLSIGSWQSLRTATVWCSFSILLALTFGCAKKTGDHQSVVANQTDPQWVKQHTPHADVALVFIHGIFGNTLDTWTAPGGPSFFKLILEDPTVGRYVDVYAFGFTSKMFGGGSFDIQEAADKLEVYIDHDLRQQGYKQIVFVGHSMGGLVILKYLLTHHEMLEHVPLVVFYATPQTGYRLQTSPTSSRTTLHSRRWFPGTKTRI